MDVLLVTVDSLRYDAVFERERGPDARPRVRPGLDAVGALARDGTVFATAFSNAAYTAQSFRSILGGTYPWMYGTAAKGFGAARPHLAEEFAAAGYRTAGFHSNPHLTALFGYDRGFETFPGRDGDAAAESRFQRLQTALRRVVPDESRAFDAVRWAYRSAGVGLGIQLGGKPYVPGDELTARAVDWARDHDDGRPRFLWVHYMDVHNPYYPHPGTESAGVSEREAIRLFHAYTGADGDDASGSAADVDALRRLYAGEVSFLDDCLGDLLAGLADAGMDLDAGLVAFGSDHGDAFGEHGVFFHPGSMYDELLHVPLVVRGPGFGPGVVDAPVTNADLMPTLLAAVGAHVPDACVGADLAPFVATPPADRLVFAHARSQVDGTAMATDGRRKLIRDLSTDTDRLYDRASDPDELAPLAVDDHPAGLVLRAALDDHVAAMRAHDADGEGDAADPAAVPAEVRDRLRQLGYHD